MILQDVIKYIAVTKHRVLCDGGWKLKSNLENCQIKLFKSSSHVQQFFENSNYIKPKYDVEKVKVRIEVLENES